MSAGILISRDKVIACAEGRGGSCPLPLPTPKKTQLLQLFWSAGSSNFTMLCLRVQLLTTDSLMLMKQQSKG